MTTILETAADTETADRMVRQGLAAKGDLISSSGKIFRVDRLMKGGVNYAAQDQDGRNWKVRVSGAKAAPAGAVFGGVPGAEVPDALWPGTVVEFVSGKWADGTRFVVLRDNGDTVSVTKLGGSMRHSYIRGVGYSHVRVVEA
jgi:hypothetical protein